MADILEGLDFEALTAKEIDLGATSFRFLKFGTMDGWRVLESIRAQLGESSANLQVRRGMDDLEWALQLGREVMRLPIPFMDALRQRLFTRVEFKTDATSWGVLTGGEDTAFENLEPSAVYEVVVRALFVNFTDSCRDLFAKISRMMEEVPAAA